jgi:hypothetical protein
MEVTASMRMKGFLRKKAAHVGSFLMAVAVLFGHLPVAHAAAGNNNLKIIAWYGAGNLAKSEYARDTVILFNPTQAPITMNNWSLQTGGTTGAFTAVNYLLPVVTIPAGGFYAITGSGPNYISGVGCTSSHCNLNYPYDYQLGTLEGTASITQNSLSSTAVTVALVNNQSPLGTCPKTSANLVDLVGIGASDGSSPVTCFAGASYAPYTPATLDGAPTNINGVVYAYATVRKNKCGDTFVNSNDFMVGFIDFANSHSAPQPCPTGKQLSVTAGATPNSLGLLDPFTVTAAVIPATSPASTALNVTADLSNLGLSSTTQLYDDGTHGDAVAGDNTYSLATASVVRNVNMIDMPGLIVTAADAQGNTARTSIPLTLGIGDFILSTPNATGTVGAGGTVTFPITIKSEHGYSGIIAITCTGSPNTNSLGVPISTQCVSTPPQIVIAANGSASISLVVATGTTFSAGILSRSLPLCLLGFLSIGLLTVGVWRRKYLPAATLMALIMLVTLNTTACGTNAGLGNTSAAPGVYTYTVTGADSNISSVNNSVILSVTVK